MSRLIDADELLGMLSKGYETKRALDLLPTVDQWHYPSKGEYPTENGKYLVDWRGEYGEHIDIDQWSNGEWLYIGEVVAWQYIEPPKEEV